MFSAHTHNSVVMNVLTNLIVAVLLQHIPVSSYHMLYLELTQLYTLIILNKYRKWHLVPGRSSGS